MSKELFIYKCPVCRSINKVTSDNIYHSYLTQNVCHQCPSCGRRTVLVYESCYWSDNKPHLNPDIQIMYWEDYIKRLKEGEND